MEEVYKFIKQCIEDAEAEKRKYTGFGLDDEEVLVTYIGEFRDNNLKIKDAKQFIEQYDETQSDCIYR